MSMKNVKKWLTDFKSLSETNHESYGELVRNDKELIDELYCLLNHINLHKYNQLLDPVCHQLFNFYRSSINNLHYFAIEFIPVIVGSYLSSTVASFHLQSGGLAAFLLGVYNLGNINKSSINPCPILPSLSQPSVYHDPSSISLVTRLTETALKVRLNCEHAPINQLTQKKYDAITPQNRSIVLSFVIGVFNLNITSMSFRSRKTLCHLCSKLSRTGFDDFVEATSPTSNPINIDTDDNTNFSTFQKVPETVYHKIPFDESLIIEILVGIYYLMFNGLSWLGMRAVDDVHLRASYDLNYHVLLVTNAFLNSLHLNSLSGDVTQEDNKSLSVTTSPLHAHHHPKFTKDAITNASFRTRKLPDDIEEQEPDKHHLESLPEEQNEQQHTQQQTPTPSDQDKSPFTKATKLPLISIIKKDKSQKPHKNKEVDSAGGDQTSGINGVLSSLSSKKSFLKNNPDQSMVRSVQLTTAMTPSSANHVDDEDDVCTVQLKSFKQSDKSASILPEVSFKNFKNSKFLNITPTKSKKQSQSQQQPNNSDTNNNHNSCNSSSIFNNTDNTDGDDENINNSDNGLGDINDGDEKVDDTKDGSDADDDEEEDNKEKAFSKDYINGYKYKNIYLPTSDSTFL